MNLSQGKPFSRLMALVLSAALMLAGTPIMAFAEEAGCNHEHDEACGYAESAECGHVCDETCGGVSLGNSGVTQSPTNLRGLGRAATGTMSIGGETNIDLAADVDKLAAKGWKWVASSNTLTLDSSYTGDVIAIYCTNTDTINLVCSGNVNVEAVMGTAITCTGSLVVSGSGSDSLKATGGDDHGIGAVGNLTIGVKTTAIGSGNGHGIVALGSVIINAQTKATGGSENGNGISADVNIVINAETTATGGDSSSYNGGSGIYAGGDVTINAATTATGGKSTNAHGGEGIYAADNVIINNTTAATGGEGGINGGCGISADVNVEINAATTVTGGEGIWANSGDVKINNGADITIEADDNGIYAQGGVTINSGAVNITADGGHGIYAQGGNATINGGSVEITSTNNRGIMSNCDVEISGSTVTIDAAYAGIGADNTVTIRSGEVNITSTGGHGIAGNDVEIKSGTVDIDSCRHGIHAENDVTISGGKGTIKTSDTSGYYSSIAVWQGGIDLQNGITVKGWGGSGYTVGSAIDSHTIVDPIYDDYTYATFVDEADRTKPLTNIKFSDDWSGVPSVPQNFKAVAGDGKVTLSWSAPADVGGSAITGYELYYTIIPVWDDIGLITSCPVSGLTNGQEYTFRVRAKNSEGPGDYAEVTATPTAAAVAVSGVTLDLSTLTLVAQGDTRTLTATVLPANASNKAVTWQSSNTAVATVDASGVVAGIAEGTATITVTTQDGNKTATCAVTVLPADTVWINVTGVSVSPASVSMNPGNTRQLTATVSPADATIRDVSWSSSDLAVATVDGYGMVTAVASGNATITATTVDGGFTATCAVTVTSGTGGVIPGSSGGGSSGGGSGSSGGGSTTTTTTTSNTPSNVSQSQATDAAAKAAAAAKASGGAIATVNMRNVGNITLAALQAMARAAGMPVKFQADSMSADGKTVEVRITLDPGKSTKGLNLSASTSNAGAKTREAAFEKWFKNNVSVVSFAQQGDFGQPVEIAAKVDLTGMDTKNLYSYSYDKKTNTYRRIEKPAYWIDKNGYLRFVTELAGDIIISEGPLERK